MRRWTLLRLVAVVGLLTSCTAVRASGVGRSLVGGALPDDPCTLVPSAVRELLVPSASPARPQRRDTLDFSQRAGCELATDRTKATSTAHGQLSWSLERYLNRYGQTRAIETAQRTFAGYRSFGGGMPANSGRTVDGLGDEAIAATQAFTADDQTYKTYLAARSGADVLTITYYAGPSTAELIHAAVVGLARSLFATLHGQSGMLTTTSPFDNPAPQVPMTALKDLPGVSVVGPTWQPGEESFTVSVLNFPFAFRIPRSWNCFLDTKVTEGTAWTCGAPNSEGPDPARLRVLVRACPGGCTDQMRARMDIDWVPGGPPPYRRFDATTNWVDGIADGRYSLLLSHFFGAAAGAPLAWHVGVQAQVAAARKESVQKVVNDVRSQTP